MRSTIAATCFLLPMAICAQIATPDRPVTEPRDVTSRENPRAAPAPIEDLGVARRIFGSAWSADGEHVYVATDLTGRVNLWRVDASGSWPVQLTQSEEAQIAPVPSPDGQTLLFHQDAGGNERFDVFAVPTAGGPVTRLTSTPDISEIAVGFSPDGRYVALNLKGADEPAYSLGLMDVETGRVRTIVEAADPEGNWTAVGWMPDSESIIANRMKIDFTEASIWRIEVATGARTQIAPPDQDVYTLATGVSPDGRLLAITSRRDTGQLRAGLLQLETGEYRWLTPTPWEQYSGQFSPDGTLLLTQTNEDGRVTVGLVEVASATERSIDFPQGTNAAATSRFPPFSPMLSAFAPDSRRLLILHTATNTPGDLWITDVDAGDSRPLTRLSMASISESVLPPAEIVTYRSFDGTLVSAVLTVPHNLQRDGSHPAVVVPHGGPTGQAGDQFDVVVASLASRGYLVIQPNFRGSTGYGVDFQMANVGDLGGGDFEDVLAARDFLIATGYVDPSRIGITGASYGGFMTLMALGKAPDAFAAGVQVFGIINWLTMYETSDPLLQQYLRGLLGDPVEHRDRYQASSPITYIRSVKAPLLSLQGENDIRVPRTQAEELARALAEHGVFVETVFYADEGHGLLKAENMLDSIRRGVAWFEEHLRP